MTPFRFLFSRENHNFYEKTHYRHERTDRTVAAMFANGFCVVPKSAPARASPQSRPAAPPTFLFLCAARSRNVFHGGKGGGVIGGRAVPPYQRTRAARKTR